MSIKKNIARKLSHLVFGIRRYNDRMIKQYANNIRGKRILEIGSGKSVNGEFFYSAQRYFDSSNDFIQTDIDTSYGHTYFDVLNPDFAEQYDIILCMNVLEHIYEYQKAVDNMYRLLVGGGELVVFVPFIYPLHDEPHDYWRFTEHALKVIFTKFRCLKSSGYGIAKMPVAYFAVYVKSEAQ